MTLVPAGKAYSSAAWPDDHFAVMHAGKPIGGMSRESMSGNAERWWWEITTRDAHRAPAATIKGAAASRNDAMQAFRAAWDALGKFPAA